MDDVKATISMPSHYSIIKLGGGDPVKARDALFAIFPEDTANSLNFVLFSTSGVHGSYETIEDIEADLNDDSELTVLVVQPRIVALQYGRVRVTAGDIPRLKRLRQSSWQVMAEIGHG